VPTLDWLAVGELVEFCGGGTFLESLQVVSESATLVRVESQFILENMVSQLGIDVGGQCVASEDGWDDAFGQIIDGGHVE
jgi:hypothetical protein